MDVMYQINPEVVEYDGYVDLNGQFIPFSMADEVFTRVYDGLTGSVRNVANCGRE